MEIQDEVTEDLGPGLSVDIFVRNSLDFRLTYYQIGMPTKYVKIDFLHMRDIFPSEEICVKVKIAARNEKFPYFVFAKICGWCRNFYKFL